MRPASRQAVYNREFTMKAKASIVGWPCGPRAGRLCMIASLLFKSYNGNAGIAFAEFSQAERIYVFQSL